ncbi:MAG: magnesium transporter CorA family protein [Chthoniobacterales bacterium]|nr:magnesium transporter CorA family protein [Chthoniobacterales bacterium]
MITFYAPGQPGVQLADHATCADLTRAAVWIDLLQPSPEDEQALEEALGVDIPTREEMQAIELSSRLYEENGILFMTATVLTNADSNSPQSSAVTFILSGDKLVTLRYADSTAFAAFQTRRDANLQRYDTSYHFMGGIIDAIIERIADILEGVGANLDRISLRVFDAEAPDGSSQWENQPAKNHSRKTRRARQRGYVEVLRRIGAVSDLVSRARETLVSFGRLVAFFREVRHDDQTARESMAHSKTVIADLGSLSDHATFLGGKVSFLLDATLGMINNEQNAIIKILSVAALVFLPPTLVAGIYGMNFESIPELKWVHGYPFALTLMIISAVLPYLFFRRKGWL